MSQESSKSHRRRATVPEPPLIINSSDVLLEEKTKANDGKPVFFSRRKVPFVMLSLIVIIAVHRLFVNYMLTAEYLDDDQEKPLASSSNPQVLKVHLERSGWSPQIGSLVEKRPPRPCTQTEIAIQMFDLLVYRTKQGSRRAFFNLDSTKPALKEDAMDRQWKEVKNIDATFVFASLQSLKSLPNPVFQKLYFAREGSTYLNVIYGGLGLNSIDDLELFSERSKFTQYFGCDYNDLQIQLPQFRSVEDCEPLKVHIEKSPRNSLFEINKDAVSSAQILQKLGDCKSGLEKQFLIQKPLVKPLLLDSKHKFVVRSFCLVGSTMPFMVFFRRGFVVVGGNKKVSFESFQRTLANGKITGTHFIDTFLLSSMKQITLFAFQAARKGFIRRKGSFQVFSLDFEVSEEMKIYLKSTNPNPDLEGSMVTEMIDLVMELGEEPGAFARMITGDKYGSFELIFSELRETCEGAFGFNPCQLFKQYNTQNLAKANKKISVTHNAANREHHEETRIVKKLDEEKKAKCKEKGYSFESRNCDKYAKQLEDEEFEKLFAEHEKDWNPNAFKLAQPGEVFPWEIV